MNRNLKLRKLTLSDCSTISKAFTYQGWNKPAELYEEYIDFQDKGFRDIIVAEVNGEFAGYLTIKWDSDYLPFKETNIPEIVDLNVLKKFQRKGIATAMMDEAENRIKKISIYAGIGFGITKDYGPAQIMYVKRNYIPDGKGLFIKSIPLEYGDNFVVSDDIVMYLIKKL